MNLALWVGACSSQLDYSLSFAQKFGWPQGKCKSHSVYMFHRYLCKQMAIPAFDINPSAHVSTTCVVLFRDGSVGICDNTLIVCIALKWMTQKLCNFIRLSLSLNTILYYLQYFNVIKCDIWFISLYWWSLLLVYSRRKSVTEATLNLCTKYNLVSLILTYMAQSSATGFNSVVLLGSVQLHITSMA